MRDAPGNPTDTADDTSRRCSHLGEGVTAASSGSERFTRRQALAAAGTLSLGMTAGCLDSVPFLNSSRVPIEPEAPGDDPDASPEEFYYILEDNGIIVDELYHDTENNDLLLFYESEATDREASDDEIGLIYILFRDGLVERGSDINHLYTEVIDGFETQVEGWGVNSDWARQDLDGEVDELAVWNQIVTTMVYPDGEERFDEHDQPNDTDTETNESDAELETHDAGNATGDGTDVE
ncbi:hypothetical protein [Natrarchaeobaculum sulfurireducens]|uniref:DUF8159 domain-containing protein n=1 Tax=Natrarchaeobaculum sulfurireducens TaxID=2044521 RepID=A0A346PNT3_9EURY|nr:hypothetical protein [Natrarchaeobaculum sulfurireducens]AXR78774.1 hypothetical protein AArc1_2459 [Natrarchaeobaculum sulfurireducens]AXR81178.1 hypothetical protein AArcMg_1162 [Natrarchaeobaculum sulfurireducens]